MTTTMRAVVLEAPGSLDALQIRELPIPRHQRPAVMMACQNFSAKEIESLRHALVAQMRDVEDHPDALEFAKEFDAAFAQ